MAEALIGGACGFLVYFAAVATLLRVVHGIAPALTVITASILIYGGMLAVVMGSGWTVLFWPLSATYWFLALSFLMAFGAIYKSISLRILLDLLNRSGRSASYEAILARYVEDESYATRLKALASSGWAIRTPIGIQLTDTGRRIAATMHAVQNLFKIERSG